MVTAELKNYRQSPRKVRLVADAIRGKHVADALDILLLATQKAALPLKKLVESAIANADHNHGLNREDLFIKEIRVDEGVTLHRWRARARGRAAPIRKRTSRVKIVLATKDGEAKVAEAPKTEKVADKPAKKAEKKPAAKSSAKTAKKTPAKKKAPAKKAAKTTKANKTKK
jgi:large subunit ribosomal protein L22